MVIAFAWLRGVVDGAGGRIASHHHDSARRRHPLFPQAVSML